MIKWEIRRRLVNNEWDVWDAFVDFPSGLGVALYRGMNSELAVANTVDRFMDVKAMDNYFRTVSYTPNLEMVHKAMLHDKMDL